MQKRKSDRLSDNWDNERRKRPRLFYFLQTEDDFCDKTNKIFKDLNWDFDQFRENFQENISRLRRHMEEKTEETIKASMSFQCKMEKCLDCPWYRRIADELTID